MFVSLIRFLLWLILSRLGDSGLRLRPANEVLYIRLIGVAAIVLTPGQDAVEQIHIDVRHAFLHEVVTAPQVARSQQPENRLCRNRGHEAALMVEPVCVASLGNSVADECE